MGPSVSFESFPLPLRIAQELPIRNSWKIISESYRIPLPIFYYFELIREALANTLYIAIARHNKVYRVHVKGVVLCAF